MKKAFFVCVIALLPTTLLANTPWVQCVQQQLNDLGYEAGPADGLLGRKTVSAGDQYISFMKSNYAGWNMPSLNKGNPEHWCRQLANANPKVSKYYEMILASLGASTMNVRAVEVERNLKAGEPYPVDITFSTQGDGAINIDAACFTWNSEGPYCFPIESVSGQTVSLKLVTGNPSSYQLNSALQYTSGGKQFMTNWFTSSIDVKP